MSDIKVAPIRALRDMPPNLKARRLAIHSKLPMIRPVSIKPLCAFPR